MNKTFLLAGLLMSCIACGDKEKSTDLLASKRQLLTEKEWVVRSLEEKVDNGTWEDVFSFFIPCTKDNTFKFTVDGKVIYGEGVIACTPNIPQQELSRETWVFNSMIDAIIIDGLEHKLVELSRGKMITLTEEISNGVKIETKVTYIHK